MFRAFRRLLAAIDQIAEDLGGLTNALLDVARMQQELGPASERLDALERERAQFHAEIEGLLLRAEGKLRAANNSEARERQLKKSYERLVDPLDENGDGQTPTRRHADSDNDAPAGEAEGMPPLRLGVAPTNKTLAQRAKFGVK